MTIVLGVLGTLLAALFGIQILYILILTFAAVFYHKPKINSSLPQNFVILIPSHNEALNIPTVLSPIKALRAGPLSPNPTVVVIADNCTDETAQLAREAGVVVYERNDLTARGKGHALEWAIKKLPQDFPDYTACVIFDADTIPNLNFLKASEEALNRGAKVIQGRYDILNPFENRSTLMLYIAFALANHVRPLGRMMLKLSDGLRGNGMVFQREVLENVPWQAYSLAEDIEYTNRLVQQGYKVEYVPEASIKGQAPNDNKQAVSQRLRWEGGRGVQARKDVPPLLRQALRKGSPVFFDRAFDLLIPPLALLVMLVISVTIFNTVVWAIFGTGWLAWNAEASLAMLLGLTVYVIGGLLLARVPAKTYMTLAFVPFYLVWKIKVYALLVFRRLPTEWVRTERTAITNTED